MDNRVAVISIIVEREDAIEVLNNLLHEARQYIIGRMGIPYRLKGITFSPEEMSFVLEILKDGKSKEEQAQIDRMVRMVSGYAKRAGK